MIGEVHNPALELAATPPEVKRYQRQKLQASVASTVLTFIWLAFLGLMCATLVARSSPVKAIAGMFIGQALRTRLKPSQKGAGCLPVMRAARRSRWVCQPVLTFSSVARSGSTRRSWL